MNFRFQPGRHGESAPHRDPLAVTVTPILSWAVMAPLVGRYSEVAIKIANDGEILRLLRTSYKEPEKSKFEEELVTMVSPDFPKAADPCSDFLSYCGCAVPE